MKITVHRVTAKAPCRVDLAGGTLDIWPLYLFHPGAVTVNFAVDLYARCTVETRRDSQIVLRSQDLSAEETFPSLAALRDAKKYRLPIPARLVRYFAPPVGLTILTHSEAPAGAGISGSSALMIALTSALHRLCAGPRLPLEAVRVLAQNIEAQVIRVPTGCQDYYPALYGGVSAIELTEAGVMRKPLALDPEDLNRRMVLAYTGAPRNSGINNWEVTKAHIDGDAAVHRNFQRIAAIAAALRCALERADWTETGRLLREEWANRRKNAPGISTPLIDRLVEVTRKAGATGAKVCGAGGGGCVFFLAEPEARERIASAIQRAGAQVLPVRVAARGVVVRAEA
ncbi:MAG: GHMP kinase [Acidobacteriia bacterium]|nr:GHMP kinase [Terriglobia bacterium]